MEWSWQDYMTLIEQVRLQLPGSEKDHMPFSKRLKKISYDRIFVPGKTTEECTEKIGEMIKRMRKVRSLSEIFGQFHNEFSLDKRDAFLKYVSDTPKPQPPQIQYLQKSMGKVRKSGVKASPSAVSQMMKEYHNLSPEKKNKYMERYKQEMIEYKKETEREASIFLNNKIEGVDALACNLFVNKKVEKKFKKNPDADRKVLFAKYREKWQELEIEGKRKYIAEATELKRAEMDASGWQPPSGDETTGNKLPHTPKATARTVFIKEYMASGHSFAETVEAWKNMSESDKKSYKQKARSIMGDNVKVQKQKRKVSGWCLFVKQHMAKGNTMSSAGAAWHALSERKRKKFNDKASQIFLEKQEEDGKTENEPTTTTTTSTTGVASASEKVGKTGKHEVSMDGPPPPLEIASKKLKKENQSPEKSKSNKKRKLEQEQKQADSDSELSLDEDAVMESVKHSVGANLSFSGSDDDDDDDDDGESDSE